MNCFTLEASMHAYIADDHKTKELTCEDLAQVGTSLGLSFSQFNNILINDQIKKQAVKEAFAIRKELKAAKDHSVPRDQSLP